MPLKIDVEEFINICDEFTNKSIFETDEDGNLKKDELGRYQNLTMIIYDNYFD